MIQVHPDVKDLKHHDKKCDYPFSVVITRIFEVETGVRYDVTLTHHYRTHILSYYQL